MSDAAPNTAPVTRSPGRPSRADEVQTQRRRRQGTGTDRNLRLYVPADDKDPNFEYRWVNDREGRVRRLYDEDWDVVSYREGDKAANASSEGTQLKRVADQHSGLKTVLMRKPKPLYSADKMAEQKLLDERDETMRRGALNSPEGLSGPETYVPGGRNIVDGK